MPEYLAPGVYVEEIDTGPKPIDGVGTATAGFVGSTRTGPVGVASEVITCLAVFEQIYGDGHPLVFGDSGRLDNSMWHAVRAFFEEGGKRLYVVRTFRARPRTDGCAAAVVPQTAAAASTNPDDAPQTCFPTALSVRARFPGAAGNIRVRFTLRLADDAPGQLADRDVVRITRGASPSAGLPDGGRFYLAWSARDPENGKTTWRFEDGTSTLPLDRLTPRLHPSLPGDRVQAVNMSMTVTSTDGAGERVWTDLALDPAHERNLIPDRVPIAVAPGAQIGDGLGVLDALLRARPSLRAALANPQSSDLDRSLDCDLTGGDDGDRPTATEYEGSEDDVDGIGTTGLRALAGIDEVSVVAAPGSTWGLENGYRAEATAIVTLLAQHAERSRYRIAVLDSGNGQSPSQVGAMRVAVDSSYAALYYPWIRILDPLAGKETCVPPSGFVAGIYARSDAEHGVHRPPADEVVTLATGLEQPLSQGQQELLNSAGINCLRDFGGRGIRLWGARTLSADPAWKYVNVRRFLIYIEHSLYNGTRWVVFEPNGDRLWANVRRTVEDFLYGIWRSGALQGERPEQAYFVRCDRSTMTQDDVDSGRLVCEVGVAPVRPAEYVILRIGQWTVDRPYDQLEYAVDLDAETVPGSPAGFEQSSTSNIGPRKLLGLDKYNNVTLKRGLVGSAALQQWLDQIRNGDQHAVRTILIRRRNADGGAVRRTWRLLRARLVKLRVGPFRTQGTAVATEELVLSCEGLETE